jgi:hypothetical protein
LIFKRLGVWNGWYRSSSEGSWQACSEQW